MEATEEKMNWLTRGTQVWQMILSLGGAVGIFVSIYAGAMTRMAVMEKDGQSQDEKIERLEDQIQSQNDKLDKILDKVTTIQIDLKDKEDRK